MSNVSFVCNIMSSQLEKYLSYYGGAKDWHLQAFLILRENFSLNKVLYAGSWIHITPSLVYSHVVYVDLSLKMEKIFTDTQLLHYVSKNATYKGSPKIIFHQSDYKNDFGEEKNSFDLLISLNSGFVSQVCSSYLKKDGLLLANNEHFDATKAYVDPLFKAIGVFKTSNKLIQTKKEIEKYFITTEGSPITFEMVEENSKRSPSKAKFKLKKKAPLYLFQKIDL